MRINVKLPRLSEVIMEHQNQFGAPQTVKEIIGWLCDTPTLREARMLKDALGKFMEENPDEDEESGE